VREFDSSIVSALEIAAGLVGAALHRERLLETVRIERERAAEERLTQLGRANALLRENLVRLARPGSAGLRAEHPARRHAPDGCRRGLCHWLRPRGQSLALLR